MQHAELVSFCKGLTAIGGEDYVDWVLDEWVYWSLEEMEDEITFPAYLAQAACNEGFRTVITTLLGYNLVEVPSDGVKKFYLVRHSSEDLADLLIAESPNWKLEVFFRAEAWQRDFKQYRETEFKKIVMKRLIREHLPWLIACPDLDKSLYFRDLCDLEVHANDFYEYLAEDRADDAS